MESPSLTKSEHHIDVTVNHDSSSNDEHNVAAVASPPMTREIQPGPSKFRLCDPFSEFVATLVLIFTALPVLILTKDEQQEPKKSLYPWIIGYIYVSISTLPILYWRFRQYSSDIGTIDGIRELKIVAEYALVGWVVSLVWYFIDNSSSLGDTTSYFWLCLAFVAFSLALHVLPNLDGAVICFCVPMAARLIPLGIHACLLYFQLTGDIMWYVGAVSLFFICITCACGCACYCLSCICCCCD